MGLLDMNWFSPELLASAVATIAGQALGFGQAAMVVAAANRLLTALGVPFSVKEREEFAGLTVEELAAAMVTAQFEAERHAPR